MFHDIVNIDFSQATNDSGTYTFKYNVYKAVDGATAGWVSNLSSFKFSPMAVTKYDGYYKIDALGVSGSLYVTSDNPNVVTNTAP